MRSLRSSVIRLAASLEAGDPLRGHLVEAAAGFEELTRFNFSSVLQSLVAQMLRENTGTLYVVDDDGVTSERALKDKLDEALSGASVRPTSGMWTGRGPKPRKPTLPRVEGFKARYEQLLDAERMDWRNKTVEVQAIRSPRTRRPGYRVTWEFKRPAAQPMQSLDFRRLVTIHYGSGREAFQQVLPEILRYLSSQRGVQVVRESAPVAFTYEGEEFGLHFSVNAYGSNNVLSIVRPDPHEVISLSVLGHWSVPTLGDLPRVVWEEFVKNLAAKNR